MTLAYPGEKSSLAEHIARDVFLTAFNDPEFELKIREREPVDLDEALKLAQRFEVFKSAVLSSSSRDRSSRHIIDTGSEDTSTVERRLATLEAELHKSRASITDRTAVQPVVRTKAARQEAEKRVAELSAEVDALNKEVGRLHYLEQLRNANSGLTAKQSESGSTKKLYTKKTCYGCGQAGHFVKDCPQHLGEYGQSGLSSRICGKTSQVSTADAVYLDLCVNGRNCECLLDTGSDITLIPTKYVQNIEVKDTSHALKAANGTEIAVTGEVCLSFALGKYEEVINGNQLAGGALCCLGIQSFQG